MFSDVILARSLRALMLAVGLSSASPLLAAESWDMALPWGANEFHTLDAQKFAQMAHEVTKGELSITVHPGGVLGIKGPETIRSVRDGVVAMADAPLSQAIGEIPIGGLESLPYLVSDQKELKELHKVMLPEFEAGLAKHNVKLLYVVPWPASQIFSRRELKSPEDFKGLKVRAADSNAAQFFEALGATPIQMPIADVLPALASGALDATTTSTTTAADQKYWEFLPYAYLTNHIWTSNAMVVNLDAWNALSPENRTALETLASTLQDEFWTISGGEDVKAIKRLETGGMKVLQPSADLIAAMKEAAQPVWKTAYQRIGPRAPQLVEQYEKAIGRN